MIPKVRFTSTLLQLKNLEENEVTWAYLAREILSFNHWDDAAQRCIPIFAAVCCQPRTCNAYTSHNAMHLIHVHSLRNLNTSQVRVCIFVDTYTILTEFMKRGSGIDLSEYIVHKSYGNSIFPTSLAVF